MDQNQAQVVNAPPPYTQQPNYPPQGQPGYPPQGYAPQPQGYPPQGYPPQGYPAPQTYPPPQPIIAPVSTVSNNVTVVTGGPQIVVAEVYPSDYCGMAWFACLCCFWPLGVCAIINANNAQDAISRGDMEGARYSSMMARKYANWSIVIGICLIILIIIVSIVAR